MRHFVFGIIASAAAVSFGANAYADRCTNLSAGKTFCGHFCYSVGACNSYTATFGPGNAFDLNGNSPGTYVCPGRSFIEVNYAFGGFENQVWYGKIPTSGNPTGFGKSTTNNYLYRWTLTPGACPASPTSGKHQQQNQ